MATLSKRPSKVVQFLKIDGRLNDFTFLADTDETDTIEIANSLLQKGNYTISIYASSSTGCCILIGLDTESDDEEGGYVRLYVPEGSSSSMTFPSCNIETITLTIELEEEESDPSIEVFSIMAY
jgi:hypothetical protein